MAYGGRIFLEKRQPNDASDSLDFGRSVLEFFTANVCGRDLREGKPNPEIFLLAAAELHAMPVHCFVVEDAPAGIRRLRRGTAALGVARLKDASELRAAGADLVVTSLDEVAMDALAPGGSAAADMIEPGMMNYALRPTADTAWVLEAGVTICFVKAALNCVLRSAMVS